MKLKIIFFVSILALFSLPSYGDEDQASLNYVQLGGVRETLDDYARTLLLNPNQTKTQERFFLFSQEKLISSEDKLKVISIHDLFALNNNLGKRRQYFLKKLSDFKRYLLSMGIKEDVLSAAMSEVIDQRPQNKQAIKSLAVKDPLTALFYKVSDNRDRLLDDLVSMQKQMDSLRKISKLNTIIRDPEHSLDTQMVYPRDGSLPSDLTFLKEEIDLLKQHVSNLEKVIEQKNAQLTSLNQQIVNLSLEFSEQKMALNKSEDHLSNFEEESGDLQQRFELGQKIISDKDSVINQIQEKVNSLEEQVHKQKSEFDQLLASKDEKLIEISGILEIYQGKLFDTTTLAKKKEATVSALEDQLNLIQEKMFHQEVSLSKTKNSIQSFNEQLEKLENVLKGPGVLKDTSDLAELLEQVAGLKSQLKKIEIAL